MRPEIRPPALQKQIPAAGVHHAEMPEGYPKSRLSSMYPVNSDIFFD
jgi:hypothetical protein